MPVRGPRHPGRCAHALLRQPGSCALVLRELRVADQKLVNRILGVRSLIELGQLNLLFKPTLDMEADLLTKFMGAKLLMKQRKLLGCVPPRQ